MSRKLTSIIVDDEVDTAGTLTQATTSLYERGARAIYAAATHGVLSGHAMQRLSESPLSELALTDTLPLSPDKQSDRIKVLSLAPLLASAILNIHTGQSVGELFR